MDPFLLTSSPRPDAITISLSEKRILTKKPNDEKFEAPGPLDLTPLVVRKPLEVRFRWRFMVLWEVNQPMQMKIAPTFNKNETWAVGSKLRCALLWAPTWGDRPCFNHFTPN